MICGLNKRGYYEFVSPEIKIDYYDGTAVVVCTDSINDALLQAEQYQRDRDRNTKVYDVHVREDALDCWHSAKFFWGIRLSAGR